MECYPASYITGTISWTGGFRPDQWLDLLPGTLEPAQPGCNLIARLDHTISKYQANPALLTDSNECNAAELQIINDLSASFTDLYSDTAARRTTAHEHRKTLHRTIEYSEHLKGAITVPELAARSGMSQRSLELAFQESLGITPHQYLRWHRMHDVYCELLANDTGSATITTIATKWGLTELGRFAVEYKQLYGESPSATLGRHTAAPATRLSDALRG